MSTPTKDELVAMTRDDLVEHLTNAAMHFGEVSSESPNSAEAKKAGEHLVVVREIATTRMGF